MIKFKSIQQVNSLPKSYFSTNKGHNSLGHESGGLAYCLKTKYVEIDDVKTARSNIINVSIFG